MPSGVMPTDWPDPSCDFAKRRTRRGEAGCGGGDSDDDDSLAVAMEGWCWYVSIDPSCFARCRTLELGEDELGVVMIRSDGDYDSLVIVVAAMEGPLWLGRAGPPCLAVTTATLPEPLTWPMSQKFSSGWNTSDACLLLLRRPS